MLNLVSNITRLLIVMVGNLVVLCMGAISGSIGASTVFPINLLRTRLQAQGTALLPYEYDGLRDVARRTFMHEGFRGFFKGLTPNLLKVRSVNVRSNSRLRHLRQSPI
jgi:solute carrier family 25 (mitochondrial phosphate transporter), member 23/24/25/41